MNLSYSLLLVLLPTLALAAPKYGPNAVPLSLKTNAEYFRKNDAPDFWALIPYYLPQETKSGCSAAAFTTLLNGARGVKNLTSDDPLVTFKSMPEKYADERYKNVIFGKFSKETFDRGNVAVAKHFEVLQMAVKKLGIETPKTKLELHVVDQKNLEKSRKEFHEYLVKNEKSSDDFIVINFLQADLTGDPEGPGHVAVLAGYDAKKKLVLVLDPDREWYEPYWSPEAKVFDSVANPKGDPNPAWIYYQVR